MSGADKPIQRIGDTNDYPAPAIDSDGNSNVFANNILVLVDGSAVQPHVPKKGGFVHDPTFTSGGSGVVFINNVPVNFTDNPDTCGHVRIGGSGDVFVGNDVDQDTPANVTFSHGDDYDDGTPAGAAAAEAHIAQGVSSGAITTSDVNPGLAQATGKSSQGSKQVPGSTQSIGELSTSTNVTDFPDSFQLSPNFTLGQLTKKPYVTFQHPVQANKGFEVGQIVENLKNLAVNVLEPIKAQYPKMFVTNSFREGADQAQHGNGQACDMQFKGVQMSDYYDIALWIRDNVPYDQLLLEYKTGGSGLPWIHISYVADGVHRPGKGQSNGSGPTGNRPTSDQTKVMTFLNDKRESITSANGYGLTQLIGKY